MNTAPVSLIQLIPWMDQLLLIGVSSARFAFAFLLVPIFSTQVMPATVRNSIVITFGLVAFSAQAQIIPNELSALDWLWIYAREAAAGSVIGFFFGTFIWAVGSAGDIIDTKVGATVGQLVDPMGGHQDSITAILLGRFAQVVFVTAGGLTILVGVIMESYVILPLGMGGLNLNPASALLFENEFGHYFTVAFLIATPALTILYVIDLAFGLLNRFAQQFNVFSLSMPVKSVAAIFVLILVAPAIAAAVVRDLGTRSEMVGAVFDGLSVTEKRVQ